MHLQAMRSAKCHVPKYLFSRVSKLLYIPQLLLSLVFCVHKIQSNYINIFRILSHIPVTFEQILQELSSLFVVTALRDTVLFKCVLERCLDLFRLHAVSVASFHTDITYTFILMLIFLLRTGSKSHNMLSETV